MMGARPGDARDDDGTAALRRACGLHVVVDPDELTGQPWQFLVFVLKSARMWPPRPAAGVLLEHLAVGEALRRRLSPPAGPPSLLRQATAARALVAGASWEQVATAQGVHVAAAQTALRRWLTDGGP